MSFQSNELVRLMISRGESRYFEKRRVIAQFLREFCTKSTQFSNKKGAALEAPPFPVHQSRFVTYLFENHLIQHLLKPVVFLRLKKFLPYKKVISRQIISVFECRGRKAVASSPLENLSVLRAVNEHHFRYTEKDGFPTIQNALFCLTFREDVVCKYRTFFLKHLLFSKCSIHYM